MFTAEELKLLYDVLLEAHETALDIIHSEDTINSHLWEEEVQRALDLIERERNKK